MGVDVLDSNRGRQLPSYLVQQGKYILDSTGIISSSNLCDVYNRAAGRRGLVLQDNCSTSVSS